MQATIRQMVRWIASAMIAVTLVACDVTDCTPGETRCARGNRAQACAGDGQWTTVYACDVLQPAAWGWTCCADPDAPDGGVACLPAAVCEEAATDG